MALTDFLSDETGSSPAPGTSYVLANKTMDWASEMEEADFGMLTNQALFLQFIL